MALLSCMNRIHWQMLNQSTIILRSIHTRSSVSKKVTAVSSPRRQHSSSLKDHLKDPSIIIKSASSSDVNNSITQHDLMQLFTHQVTAIQIKNFYPMHHAMKLGQELAHQAMQGQGDNWKVVTSDRGLERSDVWTMGEYIPYNVAVATNQVDAYFDGVEKDLKNRRRRQSQHDEQDDDDDDNMPFLWPLDQFRLELDEMWPYGATLARDKLTGRVMGGGLPRIMFGPTRWKKGFIHADQYAPLSVNNGLFSANIYLQLPERETINKNEQEELHIWPLDVRSELEWIRHQDLLKGMTVQDAEMQIKLRKALGDPLVINVTPGDLVLLCVQRPHAAIGFQQGTRVSLQCFIQYHGSGDRLLIDI